MSRSDAPSNAELAERTARIEEQVGHVRDTVDRIEANLNEQHEELVQDVEQNNERLETLWPIYRVCRWLVPIGIAFATAIGTLVGVGMI